MATAPDPTTAAPHGSATRLGVILADGHGLKYGRSTDPVSTVLLRATLLNPPRTAAARALKDRIHRVHPGAELIPYAWHLVTHGPQDGLRSMGTRTLPGPPGSYGRLQDSDGVRAAWETTVTLARTLGSSRVALRTPAGFTPGPIGRRRVRAFFELARSQGIELLWEPEGMWEEDMLEGLAREFGVSLMVPAFDATGRPYSGPLAHRWLRADGYGATAQLRPGVADGLLAHLEDDSDDNNRANVLFGGPRNYANLRVFAGVAGITT